MDCSQHNHCPDSSTVCDKMMERAEAHRTQHSGDQNMCTSLQPYSGGECLSSGVFSTCITFETVLRRTITPLSYIRDTIAEYQESRGIPNDQLFTFMNLILLTGQTIYHGIVAVAIMLYNLFPLIDTILLVIRFAVEGLIDIVNTDTNDSRFVKLILLILELVLVICFIYFIFYLIFTPILSVLTSLFYTVFHWFY